MTKEAMQQALKALDVATTPFARDRQEVLRAQATLREALAEQPAQQELVTCSVRFPRHAPKHGEDWVIDPAFLLRVYHSIDPDAHYGFTPTMEEIETALLALEVIPSNLYTAPPQREWQGLTDEEIESCREQAFSINNPYCPVDRKSMWKAYQYIEAKLKEKNNG